MIRAEGKWLTWDDEDVFVMTAILGPDEASKGRTSRQSSVVKVARQRGVQLERPLRRWLRDEKALRKALRPVLKADDAKPKGYPRDVIDRLFPHQRTALAYFDRFPAYLDADQPGVGKTPVAIVWSSAHARKRVLVVVPNSAKRQWRREIRRWSFWSTEVHLLEGTKVQQNEIAARCDGWILAHYEALVHARDGLLKRRWDVVVLDEAHHIRNRDKERSITAFHLRTTHRLALTGHPYFNSPDEIWSILHFLYPDRYSSYWRFFSMHVAAAPKYWGGWDIIGVRDRKLLKWELAPFTIRRTKKQVYKNLPDITRVCREVELTKKGEREYAKLKKDLFVELETHNEPKTYAIWSELARTTRLRQYLVDPGLLGAKEKSVKYPVVSELMAELDGPPVIFTSFRTAADELTRRLKKEGARIDRIHGERSMDQRDRAQRRFLRGKLDALVVVTQAGGQALNLGKYGYVIWLDLPWTAADLEQGEARVDRPEEGTGKIVPTTSFRIIVRGTYEDRQEDLLEKKHGMFQEVFSPTEVWEALFS